ncbi:alpha-glucosidase [Diplodia corticola]|uniref:Alpha-glucosidase n=1 Tax=Diplodia corticola TaxID=236234 RepID=A0A1J9QZ54_9PEZI|nr:alpha-glucosidase [Diplodia corticola]OJD33657.1 alpha-glucosidase [Diplodia corticola]
MADEGPETALSRYRYKFLFGAWLLVTGAAFLRVSRQPYHSRLKSEQYETIFKGTSLAAVLAGIGLSGGSNRRRSEAASDATRPTAMLLDPLLLVAALGTACAAGTISPRQSPAAADSCPGYTASNVVDAGTTLTADLSLAGAPCNAYGDDLTDLKLTVEYQTANRLHVQIYDAAESVYQVPESVLPRPTAGNGSLPASSAAVRFKWVQEPFSFSVVRTATNETLFDTADSPLIFESQYLRLRTKLPTEPNIYGWGEHSDPFRLNTTNYTHTIWNRDSYGVPPGGNLYGAHPVYYDHRGSSGTHGVFLLNSDGIEVKINKTESDGQYLEINTLGGIFDFYFLAGPSPKDVSKQYAEIVGLPAMQAYWAFGFHQCRYGYRDVYEVAEVVANYSLAGIPLETMWTDIDYMDLRKVFTLDPARFPLPKVRELVDHLHAHQQHYVVMVDPAVAYRNNTAYENGASQDVFLKASNGSYFLGVVWPGPAVFPDWFHPNTQPYWNSEFADFFSAESGVDIDALWIDMNEAANFCNWPCSDPYGYAEANDQPPDPPPVRPNSGRPIPGFPDDFQPAGVSPPDRMMFRRQTSGTKTGLPGRELVDPPYQINNLAGSLSNKTVSTNVIHYNGLAEYDTHNLYGTMMSTASRIAMENRRPGRRPLIITRSTFAGAGKDVGHWLGDNLSEWEQYRFSIGQLLQFAALYQLPMVGSDVCGFGSNTTETLCARWALLGAFSTFYRNHNEQGAISQEFYRWPLVAEAAKTAINTRYQLLDYLYTAFHRQTQTGEPALNPLFFLYPEDANTFGIDLQYFYGDSILVSPVTEENVTTVDVYLPDDVFYDFWTGDTVRGNGSYVTLADVPYTTIPLHIRGGSIVPLRASSANTTTELRKQNFTLLIAPGLDGTASGRLYLDDGDAVEQAATSEIVFTYDGRTLGLGGTFGYSSGAVISGVRVLGGNNSSSRVMAAQRELAIGLDAPAEVGL